MEKKVYNIVIMEGCPYSYEVNGEEYVDLSLDEIRPLLLILLEREKERPTLKRLYEILFDDGYVNDTFYENMDKLSDDELKNAVRDVIETNDEETENWGQSLFTEMVKSQATTFTVSDKPCEQCGEHTWTYKLKIEWSFNLF